MRDPGNRKLILTAVVIIAILSFFILALAFFSPNLVSKIGGTTGTVSPSGNAAVIGATPEEIQNLPMGAR